MGRVKQKKQERLLMHLWKGQPMNVLTFKNINKKLATGASWNRLLSVVGYLESIVGMNEDEWKVFATPEVATQFVLTAESSTIGFLKVLPTKVEGTSLAQFFSCCVAFCLNLLGDEMDRDVFLNVVRPLYKLHIKIACSKADAVWLYGILSADSMTAMFRPSPGPQDSMAIAVGKNFELLTIGVQLCGDFETQYHILMLTLMWYRFYASREDKTKLKDGLIFHGLDPSVREILFKTSGRWKDDSFKSRFFLMGYNKLAKNLPISGYAPPGVTTLEGLSIFVGNNAVFPSAHKYLKTFWISFSKRSGRIQCFIAFDCQLEDSCFNLSIPAHKIKSYCRYDTEETSSSVLHIILRHGFGNLFVDSDGVPLAMEKENSIFFHFPKTKELDEAINYLGIKPHVYNNDQCSVDVEQSRDMTDMDESRDMTDMDESRDMTDMDESRDVEEMDESRDVEEMEPKEGSVMTPGPAEFGDSSGISSSIEMDLDGTSPVEVDLVSTSDEMDFDGTAPVEVDLVSTSDERDLDGPNPAGVDLWDTNPVQIEPEALETTGGEAEMRIPEGNVKRDRKGRPEPIAEIINQRTPEASPVNVPVASIPRVPRKTRRGVIILAKAVPLAELTKYIEGIGLDVYDIGIYTDDALDIRPELKDS